MKLKHKGACMGSVEILFYVGFLAWVAYAGYRLWTASSSATARVSSMILVAAIIIGTLQNVYENLQLSGRF